MTEATMIEATMNAATMNAATMNEAKEDGGAVPRRASFAGAAAVVSCADPLPADSFTHTLPADSPNGVAAPAKSVSVMFGDDVADLVEASGGSAYINPGYAFSALMTGAYDESMKWMRGYRKES
eukprot:gene10904-4918_t